MEILQQMIVLFIIMGIGFVAAKRKIINGEARSRMSSIVVNIANPALILSCVTGDILEMNKMELVFTLVVSIVLFLALMIVAYIIPKVLNVDKEIRGVYSAMTIFTNVGFMGFPILKQVYGNEALLLASVFLIPFNILIYTYGIALMDSNKEVKVRFDIRKILNSGVISCIVTILIFITKLKLPYILATSINMISDLTAPLSMMIIGSSMISISIRKLTNDKKLILFVLIKQFVIPIIGSVIAFKLLDNTLLCGIVMILLSTPIGAMTAMLTEQYGCNYELASKGVAISTIVSVVSIPIVSYIANAV